ncbi:MAG: M99 family carboxypeptidase catalytic domain-containing protein [Sulfurimonadaceae bacterium]|jgi:hypothetical protein|nr:M99 family carboxypeptidase catalytic domain-containing protein [Sulfurimonadaceae bacterium]
MKLFFISLFCFLSLNANVQLIKKNNDDSNTTLLVIGGIHGNEPGGYFAASVLATHYTIHSKNLWIVPNLNQVSLQRDERGIYGDMNRKFATIDPNDKDKEVVEEIKKIILAEEVSLVLNLHDGNGFYRKQHQGNIFNPNAWGQTCVIDQVKLDQNQPFGNLNEIASTVKENLNQKLLKQHHTFDVKNTNTKYEDETMQLSLTYFAVTNNKPAFAIESSKNLPLLSQKVFYQLLAIEEFMKIMDISFSRSFDLNANALGEILKEYGDLAINNNISLNLNNIKKSLSFVPIKSSSNDFEFSHPLGSIQKIFGKYFVYIGNQKITELHPQYFKLATNCPKEFAIEIDGKTSFKDFTSDIYVNDDFKVLKTDDIRVNIIGYRSNIDESGIVIALNQLDKSFSIDNNSKTYRVEFYKQDEFCSMLMVHFK